MYRVSVASTAQTVVSTGDTRAFSGRLGGGTKLLMVWMVVGVTDPRLTSWASGSVPVLTDHRSPPHCGGGGGTTLTISTNDPSWLRPTRSFPVTSSVQLCCNPVVLVGAVHVGLCAFVLLRVPFPATAGRHAPANIARPVTPSKKVCAMPDSLPSLL